MVHFYESPAGKRHAKALAKSLQHSRDEHASPKHSQHDVNHKMLSKMRAEGIKEHEHPYWNKDSHIPVNFYDRTPAQRHQAESDRRKQEMGFEED